MTSEIQKTRKCPKCGKEYRIYMFYFGDQTRCPKCRKHPLEPMTEVIR